MMKNVTCIVAILLLCFGCNQATVNDKFEQNFRAELSDSLTMSIENAYDMGLLKGFSVAVVDENGIAYNKGFGWKHLDSTKLYTTSTVQPIASISKTLIGVALLKAVEMNLLSLQDPVNQYLPFKVHNPNFPDNEILIEHLAYHTSSIIDKKEVYIGAYYLVNNEVGSNEGAYDFFKKSEEKISLGQYVENALSLEGSAYAEDSFSKQEPGTERIYSNLGSDLCALIIQNAAGQNFRKFTQQYILDPLKMTSSGWRFEDIDEHKLSRLFAYQEMMIAQYSESSYASGQFMTSSEDLSLFLIELMRGYKGNGEVLSETGYRKLFAKQRHGDKYYGIFMEYTSDWLDIDDEMIGHNGADYGVFTGMYFNPDRGTGKIMISNTDTDFYDDLDVWPETRKIWQSLVDYEVKLSALNAENQ